MTTITPASPLNTGGMDSNGVASQIGCVCLWVRGSVKCKLEKRESLAFFLLFPSFPF